jgi:hypothetical protein
MVSIAEQDHQQDASVAPRPPAVSSTSSVETAAYAELNDTPGHDQSTSLSSLQQSTSLPSLAMENATPTLVGINQSLDSFALDQSSFPSSANAAAATGNESLMASVPPPTIALTGTLQLSFPTGTDVHSVPTTNTVPEFLYQLTKMLTDNNRGIIEWSNGKFHLPIFHTWVVALHLRLQASLCVSCRASLGGVEDD